MTDEQFKDELSPEYLAWSQDGSLDVGPAVQEIQRLCERIVEMRACYQDEIQAESNRALEYENGQREEVSRLRARIAELEGARAKEQGSFWEQMCRVQFHGDGMIYRGTACAIARDADVLIAAQAAELEQLRLVENVIANPIDPHTDLRHIAEVVLDRAPAQAEPQDTTRKPTECQHEWSRHWTRSKYMRPGFSFHACTVPGCNYQIWDDGRVTMSGESPAAAQPSGEGTQAEPQDGPRKGFQAKDGV